MDIVGRLPLPVGALRGRRDARARDARGRDAGRRAVSSPTRQPVRAASDVLRRERHQPDYSILLAVVALSAIGILMVFSSSAMFAYASRDDTLAIVGPQIFWGTLGIATMLLVMRLDYRWLRMLSVPGYFGALVLLALVFVPSLGHVVGGSARWLVIGPLPAVHPAEIAKLALIVYLAHWLANRGPLVGRFRQGMIPFLLIAGPVIALVFKEPDLGTTIVITLTAFTVFFVAGASLLQLGAMVGAGVLGVGALSMLGISLIKGYQLERIQTFLNPWADPQGAGFHTIQGLLALGLGGITGAGLGESKLAAGMYLPNAWNDFIFAIVGEEFGFVGAGLVILLFVLLAYAGIRTALRAPDTFGALLAAGITAWLCYQAFINVAVVVALLPVTGITLPFISAGGSSLLVSFAAAGILLSISRESVERTADRSTGQTPDGATDKTTDRTTEPKDRGARSEARRTDEAAHRGRGHRGTHLPGAGRRGRAPSPARPD